MSKLLKSFDTAVVGVTFNNDDGSSRQQILSETDVDDPVTLEFYEYDGNPACAVYVFGKQIGHVRKEFAAELAEQYNGCYFVGKVKKILGGPEYGLPNYGCVIDIYIYDEDPTSAERTFSMFDADRAEQTLQELREQSEQAREEYRQARENLSAQRKALRNAVSEVSEEDKKHNKLYGTIYIVLGIILIIISLLLLLTTWVAVIPVVIAILFVVRGYNCLKINSDNSDDI